MELARDNTGLDPVSVVRLRNCSPDFTSRLTSALLDLAAIGFGRLRVTEGFRSWDRQAQLYGHGRSVRQLRKARLPVGLSRPGLPIVTNALPSQSKHCKGKAADINIDIYPWQDWPAIGRVFERHGLTWGGRWRMRDYCHVEYDG